MRITYYEETDSAFIVLREPPLEKAVEIAGETLEEPGPERALAWSCTATRPENSTT